MKDKASKQPWKPSKGADFAGFLLSSFAWQLFLKACTALSFAAWPAKSAQSD